MLSQHLLAEFIYFTESDSLKPACHLKAKGKPAYTAENIEVSEWLAVISHGSPFQKS
jgi:hypothetical protein